MKTFQKISVFILCALLLTVTAFAAGASGISCIVEEEGLLPGTVRMDLFVPKADMENYTDTDSTAQVATFDAAGFVSYTYHCKDAASDAQLGKATDGYYTVSFGAEQGQKMTPAMKKYIKGLHNVRFVYVGEQGEILSVTEETNIHDRNPFTKVSAVRLNGAYTTVERRFDPWSLTIPIGVIVVAAALVCIIRKKKRNK